MSARLVFCAVVAIGAARIAPAQQATPPVHAIGVIVAKTVEPIGYFGGIHALSDGHVVVNDVATRRVLLFDAGLTTFTVLLDTSGATPRKYPGGSSGFAGTVIPFVGDSTVFYDPLSIALVVLDPRGRVVRVVAPPFPPDAGYLIFPGARFDPGQRLLYRASTSPRNRPSGTVYAPLSGDSAPIVRATAGRPAPDTLAYIRMPKLPGQEAYTSKDGFATQRSVVDPFVLLDEWTMLPDGTVAIIRGQDYHVDFIAPDGKKTSSAKLPFQWHRLSDSDKAVILDSVKQQNEANPLRYNVTVNGQRTAVMIPQGVIPPDSLADYRPPFRAGAMLADADGNVWIEPTPEVPLSPNPGPVYDVVNRAGKLIDRVQVSPGFGIVGFSPGFVFMTIREGATNELVKAKIR